MTLDVHLFPEGMPEEMIAGKQMDAATDAEAYACDPTLPLVRDIFPRPFSIPAPGIRVQDICMQNVLGCRSDFVHYRGVWRLQPLPGCAPPGEDMMRLTFAVECQPHWFLPVAPVEGRIAHSLAENMEAIRSFAEAQNAAKRQRALGEGVAWSDGQVNLPEDEGFAFILPDFSSLQEVAQKAFDSWCWVLAAKATSSPMMTRAARRRRPGFGATLLAPRGYRGSVSPVRRAAGPEVSEAFVGIEESAWAVALTVAALWAACRNGERSEDFVLRGGAFKASCHQGNLQKRRAVRGLCSSRGSF